MFEWLLRNRRYENNFSKKKEQVSNVIKETQYNEPDEVLTILEKWNKINQTNFSISELFSLLKLNGPDFIDVKLANFPIYNDVWKIPGYLGSLRFDICINNENSFNEHTKVFLKEIGENKNVRYFIHLCKDGFVLSMDYNHKTSDFRKFQITYKICENTSNSKIEQIDEHSLITFKPDSIYSSMNDKIICQRFKDPNGYYNIKITERIYGDIRSKIIRFKIKNDIDFNFPNEIKLMKKIGNESISFPDSIMAILVNYLKKYNIEIEEIKIEGKNLENEISRELSYQEIGDNTKVILNKKISSDIIETQKTIDVLTQYENGYNIRVFNIKTSASKDMILKVYYNDSSTLKNKDFKIIDCFMGYFPLGLIDENPEWYSFDMFYRLLCNFCFSDNMDHIDMIRLENYEYNTLVNSTEWKKYNIEQSDNDMDNPVLKRK